MKTIYILYIGAVFILVALMLTNIDKDIIIIKQSEIIELQDSLIKDNKVTFKVFENIIDKQFTALEQRDSVLVIYRQIIKECETTNLITK